jgi:hypothetical protein
MFSRDGTRLAIGGGVFYGNGGIVVVDLFSEGTELFRCDDLPHAQDDWVPAVSGVCFSDDDQHLAASSWRGRHHYAPTLLFEVSGLKLIYKATLKERVRGFSVCPTGVLLSNGYTITRNHWASANEVFVISESPRELGINADNIAQHLTNSHLAVVRNQVITAVDKGLVSVELDGKTRKLQLIPVQASREVTAIAATPDGQGFLTGGLDGEMDKWSWEGRWRQQRLRELTCSPSVRAICYLSGDLGLVAVSSSCRLDFIVRDESVRSWQSPTPGSPRALAAHPTRNWIAIGMKQSGWTDPRGVVDLIEINNPR